MRRPLPIYRKQAKICNQMPFSRGNQEQYCNFYVANTRIIDVKRSNHLMTPFNPFNGMSSSVFTTSYELSNLLGHHLESSSLLFSLLFSLSFTFFPAFLYTNLRYMTQFTLRHGCFRSDLNSVRNPDPDPAFHFNADPPDPDV